MDAIANEQVIQTGKDFYAGMFPSYRECGGSPHNYQPDNNIFYTAVGVFALKNMLPYLSGLNRQKAVQRQPLFILYTATNSAYHSTVSGQIKTGLCRTRISSNTSREYLDRAKILMIV